MIIYFNKNTGKIVASFLEVYEMPKLDITVKEDGLVVQTPEDLEELVIPPEEARDFEDPRKPDRDIHKCKVVFSPNKKTRRLVDDKGKDVRFNLPHNVDKIIPKA